MTCCNVEWGAWGNMYGVREVGEIGCFEINSVAWRWYTILQLIFHLGHPHLVVLIIQGTIFLTLAPTLNGEPVSFTHHTNCFLTKLLLPVCHVCI